MKTLLVYMKQPAQTAETITTIIKDVLCRLGLDLMDCRGQAYDGASNMSQARIQGGALGAEAPPLSFRYYVIA